MTDIAATWPGDVRFALYSLVARALPVVATLPAPLGWAGSLESLALFAAGVPPTPAPGPFSLLSSRLELTPAEELLLIASLSPDLDLRLVSLWQVLGHRIDATRPRLQSVMQLATAAERAEVLAILEPAHVLRAVALVTLSDLRDTALDVTIEARGIPAIASTRDADAAALGVRLMPAVAPTGDVRTTLRAAVAAQLGRGRPDARPWAVWIDGPEGAGRGQLARELAASSGRGTAWLHIDQERPDWAIAIGALIRTAILRDVVPCIEIAAKIDIVRILDPIAQIYRGPLVLIAEARTALPAPWQTVTASAFRPDGNRREALWRAALPEGDAATHVDLAARFPLTVGGVFRAADEARARGLEAGSLAQAAREQLEAKSSLAERSRSTKRLADLIASAPTLALLEEIIAFARNRKQVFDDWGFGRRMRGGLKVLFSGPPGTGKTLSAEIIAAELDLDLYRIDLSNVVSKWVGETEKNLKQVFDQAEAHGGVLLFDEADSLFGKRTSDVKSSNDRYANLEVNYLLQRMEGYEGIVLLTTNLETGIDEAFRRRLNFRVRFLAPEADERERLWQLMIPETVPRGEELDFEEVADRYDMAGGNIKNAALRAAILAAAEKKPLMTSHLLAAGEREFSEIGRIGK